MWTESFQMYKLDLKNAEEPEIKLPTSIRSLKKKKKKKQNTRGFQKNIYVYFIDYTNTF